MVARRYGIYLRVFTSSVPSVHVLSCLLYKHTNNDVFNDFPKISDHFPKISEDIPKLFRILDERLWTSFEDCRRFPKVAEDFRGGTDDVSIVQHHLWLLFKRLCSYSSGNLKTCDNNLIFLHVKISYFTCENISIFSVAEILIKQWCLYNNHLYFMSYSNWFEPRSISIPYVEIVRMRSSSEKNCCCWVTFRQPKRTSSSESSELVFVSQWWYKSGSLNVVGQFSQDGIDWKARVRFVISHWWVLIL